MSSILTHEVQSNLLFTSALQWQFMSTNIEQGLASLGLRVDILQNN